MDRLIMLLMMGLLPSTMAVLTTLTGKHFNFTVVHDPPYMDVGYNDGVLLEESEWKGYIVDMIKMVSNKAGFTYSLQTPSGDGSSCSGSTAVDFVTQYVCGQEDVLQLNKTQAYWSMYYMTGPRVDDGTKFTAPFMTNAGLALLTRPPEGLSSMETTFLIFKPFSSQMWIVTCAIVFFAAIVVWMHEIVHMASIKADKMIANIKGTIYRQNPVRIENHIQEDANGIGMLSQEAFKKFPSYFMGTFGGLMSSSDDSEKESDEKVVPSGNFAAAWGFFVLFWASAYTANLAATLTYQNQVSTIESIEEMARNKHVACARSGAAYTAALVAGYPQIKVNQYSTVADEYSALLAGKCDAVVDTYPVLLAMANGVLDLDLSSGTQYCGEKVIVSAPRALGHTDMSVGVSEHQDDLHEALDYWITTLRTCNPLSASSECYQAGTNGAINLETLRAQHIDRSNCGTATSSTDGGSIQLSVENFLLPILAVAACGLGIIGWYYTSYFQKITFYLKVRPLEVEIAEQRYQGAFTIVSNAPGERRRALMLDTLVLILDNDPAGKVDIILSCCKYFLYTNMENFFLLVRLANIMHPETATDADDEKRRLMKLHTAGELSYEVATAVNLLIQKALVDLFHRKGTIEDFTFICRDQSQFDRMKAHDFGKIDKEVLEPGNQNLRRVVPHA